MKLYPDVKVVQWAPTYVPPGYELCPTCRGLTYHVDSMGAHKCPKCDGKGVIPWQLKGAS